MDNVRIGSHLSAHGGFGATLLGRGEVRQTEKAIDRRAEEILELVGLTGHVNDEASTLAHGHQRALGIAVALAAKPKMLMLDEPCAGMNIGERVAMMALIKKIRDQDVTLMLVEHDMKVIMAICDSITVVSFGKLIAEERRTKFARTPSSTKPIWDARPMLLEIKNLRIDYEGVEAVRGVDISLDKGEIVTILGANGAGKSSVLRAVSGLVRPSTGQIEFSGERLDTLAPTRSSSAASPTSRRDAACSA